MKLGVMQPYFFPYIGYFQLIASVDKFVIYDDVDYIVRGWINRNRILVNQKPHLVTVPLRNGERGVKISDVRISDSAEKWKSKFLKTLNLAYKNTQGFDTTYPLVEDWIKNLGVSISSFNVKCIKNICELLKISTEIVPTSKIYRNEHLAGEQRILDICRIEGARIYINAAGGKSLYDATGFEEKGMGLQFLEPKTTPYHQNMSEFVSNLSIIDVLMFNSREQVQEMVQCYDITKGL